MFKLSDRAKQIFEEVTGKSWETYSETRWYSKYEVFEVLARLWPDMLTVTMQIVAEKVSKTSAPKLLLMLTDEATMWYLKIQMCAFVEGLEELRNMCYALEGDGQLIFFGGSRLVEMQVTCPRNGVPNMPSLNRLIDEAVAWAATSPAGKALAAAQTAATAARAVPRRVLTVRDIRTAVGAAPRAVRPQRAAAAGVANATAALRTAAAKAKEDAELALKQAELDEKHQKDIDDAMAAEAAAQAKALPMTVQKWRDQVYPPITAAYNYFWANLEDGERKEQFKLLRAAQLFLPMHGKTLHAANANALIDDLRVYAPLDNYATIAGVKDEFVAYKQHAQIVMVKKIDVLQWFYDRKADLPFFWGACKVLALVQPSSAGAERVFSLLKAFWNEQQTQSLSDAIKVSLMLAVNKRDL